MLEPERALTVLVGPNAAGKTNVIEALQVATTGTSFRNPRWDEVIRWGADEARISIIAEGNGTHAVVDVRLSRDGRRAWRVNGISKRRTTDATRFVPAVIFTPDDLALVKGPAEQRRYALDALGEQLSVTYGALRRDYARVVRQRNSALKDDADAASLAPWDEQLVTLGARLHVHRRRLARRLADAISNVYERLAVGERITMRFNDRCGVGDGDLGADVEPTDVEAALRSEVRRRSAEERARKVSLVGPHRDDVVFQIGGRDARVFASQGQQRTIALAWKWAEVAVIEMMLKRTPILLLDDVMSELDARRRTALTELVQREVQTFVTTTNTGYFDPDLLKAALIVEVGGAT